MTTDEYIYWAELLINQPDYEDGYQKFIERWRKKCGYEWIH